MRAYSAALVATFFFFVGCKTTAESSDVMAAGGANGPYAYAPCTGSQCSQPGEKVASENSVIKNLHTVATSPAGKIYRSASPVRDLVASKTSIPSNPETMANAAKRMAALKDLGVKAIVSFEDGNGTDDDTPDDLGEIGELDFKSPVARSVAVEMEAAAKANIKFVSKPMSNSGQDSLETMSVAEVKAWLEDVTKAIESAAKSGGVLFHCAEGHDRTGLVGAYMRIKFDGWSVNDAIDEMRQMGHDWKRFSHNGGQSSWHEDDLKKIAAMISN